MDDQNKNLILATALSVLVILVWFWLFPPQEPAPLDPLPENAADGSALVAPPPSSSAAPGDTAASSTPAQSEPVAEAARVDIDTARLEGSISLTGSRIDDLRLKDYRETIDDDSPIVTLLKPQGEVEAYYALYGWSPAGALGAEDVPAASSEWRKVEGDTLGVDAPVTLEWVSPSGIVYRNMIEVDEDFLFTVTQSVTNPTSEEIRLLPYGVIQRHGEPSDLRGFFIIHEGAIRQTGEEMNFLSYDDVRDADTHPRWGAGSDVAEIAGNGWLGWTDHYWMTTLAPESDAGFEGVLRYNAQANIFQAFARLDAVSVAPGGTAEATTRLFAGAKEWETIRQYEREQDMYRFVDSIDWGWFYFLTKPIFQALHWLNGFIGNMGWAIIALTLMIKAILLPLAYKSYVSMAKMKELQPEMEKIKERAGDDRQKLQQEMMELYKKEKVNPASGCLPILLQIPIFFSLYKVIFVTIELRHAPWLGPFQDLSGPDPTSILNLFGLLPNAAPDPTSFMALIFIGILPLLLGISMWLQQKLNPAPTDPTQQMIFAWMPWIFMFMLGGFASGLVIYWIANNVITFAQQYAIMRSQGFKPDVFGNIKSSFRRTKTDEK
ncbi:MAG: membrane protein insertase YidC [Rhodobacteraceae bacterium]|nr:membrane protein insertase YidC [Paracoccaceae bacterium]